MPKDAYPLSRVDDLLDNLAGSRLFSTLDTISGYWQVEVHPGDKEKTAFCTSEELYEFNVMPFGLCNGPATIQRLMNSGVQWSSCLVYLDDIIVLGKPLMIISQVFQRLREKLNVSSVERQCNSWDTLCHPRELLLILLRYRKLLIGRSPLINVTCSSF